MCRRSLLIGKYLTPQDINSAELLFFTSYHSVYTKCDMDHGGIRQVLRNRRYTPSYDGTPLSYINLQMYNKLDPHPSRSCHTVGLKCDGVPAHARARSEPISTLHEHASEHMQYGCTCSARCSNDSKQHYAGRGRSLLQRALHVHPYCRALRPGLCHEPLKFRHLAGVVSGCWMLSELMLILVGTLASNPAAGKRQSASPPGVACMQKGLDAQHYSISSPIVALTHQHALRESSMYY